MATNKLLDMLMKNSKSKFTNTIQKSKYFNKADEFTTTDVKMLNVALSGEVDGGIAAGVTMFAGKPKRFKTLYGLTIVKAFLDKHPEGICLYYDTEGGAGKRYFESLGIDVDRVIWTPCCTVEELKIEVVNQLEALKAADDDSNKVIIFVDSVGNPASKKELDDAIEGSNKADMTRAKQIKSFFRLVTLPTKLLDIPMIVINHTYDTQAFIPEEVVSGGCLSEKTKIVMKDGSLKNISEVNIGEYVKTLTGYNKVIKTWSPKNLDLDDKTFFKIIFDDGYEIECTNNHKFLIRKEDNFIWKCASELSSDDDIVKI